MTTPEESEKLGVFTVGVGAVATTLMAGVELIRQHQRTPIGSFTQLGWLATADGRRMRVNEALPLAALPNLIFGGVDLLESDAWQAARTAGVLNEADLAAVRDFLGGIRIGPGIHDPAYMQNLQVLHALPGKDKQAQVETMIRTFREFFSAQRCARGVVLLTLSTEAWRGVGAVHATPEAFVAGLRRNDPDITPSQIYAWAAVEAGYPVVNCTPNPVPDMPALQAHALRRGVPLAGSDLKSGQTLLKTVIAGGIARRLLGVKGWFSTNILGNRDGLVLADPENFRAKEITKSGVLTDILDQQVHPELYKDMVHQVRINYYPPKGDNKEAWDSIQLAGWLGYEMELKINFECRDSILAAPLVLDLALLADLAARKGEKGIQPWLGGYFKHPAALPGTVPCNDLPIQMIELERKLSGWC
jgi:myo-inositol-1-phosphate synthase